MPRPQGQCCPSGGGSKVGCSSEAPLPPRVNVAWRAELPKVVKTRRFLSKTGQTAGFLSVCGPREAGLWRPSGCSVELEGEKERNFREISETGGERAEKRQKGGERGRKWGFGDKTEKNRVP